MHRFTDMHCSRDVPEKIHKKRVLFPLPVSIQVMRLWEAGYRREEMLLFHVTDTKPGEKSTLQAALHLGHRSSWLGVLDCSFSSGFSWTSICPCTVTLNKQHTLKQPVQGRPYSLCFLCRENDMENSKKRNHVSGLLLHWLKCNGKFLHVV